ncbi:MAG: hypothetical protein ACI857_000331 [Arenicella sp.]|jgi:hypothetical protein
MRIIFFAVIVVLICACEKPKVLPPITNSAQNTFGYIIEENSIVGGDIDDNDDVYFNSAENQFRFVLRDHLRVQSLYYINETWRVLDLSFHFENFGNVQEYHMDSLSFYEYTSAPSNSYESFDSSHVDFFRMDSTKVNYVAVYRSDLMAKEISGKFRFNLYSGYYYQDTMIFDTTETLQIQSGRFDLTY